MNRVKTFGVNANLQEKSLSIIRLTMQVDDLSEKIVILDKSVSRAAMKAATQLWSKLWRIFCW